MADPLRSEAARIAFFDAHVPPGMVEQFGLIAVEAYQETARLCEDRYGPEEAHDVRPQVCRAEIERRLPRLAGVFRGTAAVTKSRNVTGTAFHTEVECGAVLITASSLVTVNAAIRWARFRETLARTSKMNLFAAHEPADAGPGTRLYAVLVHGPLRNRPELPAFAHLVFPLPDGTHSAGINIYARFPHLVALDQAIQVERIARPRILGLKAGVRPGSEEVSDA